MRRRRWNPLSSWWPAWRCRPWSSPWWCRPSLSSSWWSPWRGGERSAIAHSLKICCTCCSRKKRLFCPILHPFSISRKSLLGQSEFKAFVFSTAIEEKDQICQIRKSVCRKKAALPSYNNDTWLWSHLLKWTREQRSKMTTLTKQSSPSVTFFS